MGSGSWVASGFVVIVEAWRPFTEVAKPCHVGEQAGFSEVDQWISAKRIFSSAGTNEPECL
ncbi:hypothetical protein EFR84_12475 [Rhizobium chutanense]|uniref:Uncharacterized protein n=1 Tax=Rhizobium chutanense TaxID=2035448 RepID=A0A3S0QLM2_9HYPH|nr:hypothetical protein EFR84_12475 [Rhizobium chutanense]